MRTLSLPRLMLIADGFASGRVQQTAGDVQRQVVALVEAGLSFVQLRDHAASDELFRTTARELVEHIRSIRSELIVSVNSRVDVSDELHSGLHLGRKIVKPVAATASLHSSTPFRHPSSRPVAGHPLATAPVHFPRPGTARADMGRGASVRKGCEASGGRSRPLGFSAHSFEDIQHAATNDFDFATFSPIFPTQTHPETSAVGIDALMKVCASVSDLSLFALGGITPERTEACLDAGAFGVAVLSDLLVAADPGNRLSPFRARGAL